MSELFSANKIKECKIKSVEIACEELKNPGSEIKEYYEEFDPEGNTRLTLFYDSSGNLMRRASYRYDMKGRLIRKIYFDISRKDLIREDYIYNELGRVIEIKNFSGDSVTHNLYTYDTNGNLKEQMKCDSSGGLHELSKFIYDNGGNVAGKVVYDGFGKIISRVIHNFNQKGNKVKSITYHGKGDLHIVENYDERGRVVEMIDYGSGVEPYLNSPDHPENEGHEDPDPETPPYRMEVNDKGDIIGTEMISDELSPAPENSFVTRHTYEYDSCGQCTEEMVFDTRGTQLYRVSQRFDNNRNKIEYMIQDSPMNWLKIESRYNDKNLPFEEKIFSSDGDPGKIRKFRYTHFE